MLTKRIFTNIETTKNLMHPISGFRRKSDDVHDHRRYKGSELISSKGKYKPNSTKWEVKSGCHFGCMEYSKGIQVVTSKTDNSTNIQLCEPHIMVINTIIFCKDYNESYDFYHVSSRVTNCNQLQILLISFVTSIS